MRQEQGDRQEAPADPDLRPWRASSWAGPACSLAAAIGLWMIAFATGLQAESHWVRATMTVPLTLATAQLFMIGHDAGHNSFSTSPVLNAVAGRLALVPSLHVFALWRYHHDLHHRYTNLRGKDFVWTPLTIAEYRDLPGWRRRVHRIERHKSGLGLGFHYGVEIWAPRMLWPRRHHRLPDRPGLLTESIVFYSIVAGLAVSARQFVAGVSPHHVADVSFWISVMVFMVIVPLLATQWLIGFVIYLNHTHPDIVWYDDPAEWSRHDVQLEGSAGQRFSLVKYWFLPRRIMNHTAHHVDPGIPLRRLKDAQRHLVENFGDRVPSYEWSVGQFRETLTACKLYDYDTRRWLTYADVDNRP